MWHSELIRSDSGWDFGVTEINLGHRPLRRSRSVTPRIETDKFRRHVSSQSTPMLQIYNVPEDNPRRVDLCAPVRVLGSTRAPTGSYACPCIPTYLPASSSLVRPRQPDLYDRRRFYEGVAFRNIDWESTEEIFEYNFFFVWIFRKYRLFRMAAIIAQGDVFNGGWLCET